MDSTPEVTFVIPMYNEAEVFHSLIDRMNTLMDRIGRPCEVILVNDGSKDHTPELMDTLAMVDTRYQCIHLSRNFGHQRALGAGLDHATGAYIMMLDADLQDPPELFFDFLAKINEGFDVVYGVRQKRKEGIVKRTLYSSFYKLINRISNYPIPKNTGDFGMITRQVLKAINNNREDSRFLRGVRSWVGFRQTGLEYERLGRFAGSTKYTLRKLVKLAMDGIFNYTILPIRLLTIAGVFCMSSSFIYLFYALYNKFVTKESPEGFTALLFVVILFGGIQLISIGIIGEYVQRIFFQVKQRPLYVVRKRIHKGLEYYE